MIPTMSNQRHPSQAHPEQICREIISFLKDRVSDVQLWTSQHAHRFFKRGPAVQKTPKQDFDGLRQQSLVQREQLTRSDSAGSLQFQPQRLGGATREDLGRATWLLLHSLAAQYPENPSKQQKSDVAALVRWVHSNLSSTAAVETPDLRPYCRAD